MLKHFGLKTNAAKTNFRIERLFSYPGMFSQRDDVLSGLAVLSLRYSKEKDYLVSTDRNTLVDCSDIYGLILGCYRIIIGFSNDHWKFPYVRKIDFKEYVLKYWKLLKTIN